MPKTLRPTTKEYRGDRFLQFRVFLGETKIGWMSISWLPATSGGAFARNFKPVAPRVSVTLDDGSQDGVTLFAGEVPTAHRYQAEAYSAGRAYLRQIDARGMLAREWAKLRNAS